MPAASSMSKIKRVWDGVLGSDAPRIEALLGKVDERGWGEEDSTREAELLFGQAFEIFRERHRRYLEAPAGNYKHLLRWYDPWLSVDNALCEEFRLEIYAGYSGCLGFLAADGPDVADRKRELDDFMETLSRRRGKTGP